MQLLLTVLAMLNNQDSHENETSESTDNEAPA